MIKKSINSRTLMTSRPTPPTALDCHVLYEWPSRNRTAKSFNKKSINLKDFFILSQIKKQQKIIRKGRNITFQQQIRTNLNTSQMTDVFC